MEKGKGLIYVVDDDPFILKLVEKRLTSEGYTVRMFKFGEDCLQALKKETPALIILDYLFMKPDGKVMNGKEIFYHIKEFNADLPVIMLSGQDSGGVVLELARLGMNDYVIKDKSLVDNLLLSVKEILNPEE